MLFQPSKKTQLGVVALWRYYYPIQTNAKDRNMLLNKPNRCISSDRNMPWSLNPLRNAVRRSSLVAVPYYLNHTNTRRARCVPEETL